MSAGMRDSSLLNAAVLRWFEELADRGVFTTDRTLTIRTWNRWLEAQTGLSRGDTVGRPLFDVYPALLERGFEEHYRAALDGEVRMLSERFHRFLIPIPRNFLASGITEMAQSARIAPLLAEGQVIGTITVIDDVTERVVSERELRAQIATSERARGVAEEASRLKDEFLATLSHEIRTPLNAVLGWARILRTQPRLRTRAHALEVIERNAASQLRLVEDLLDMARVISGKLRLDVQQLDVAAVAGAAVDVVAPAAQAKSITINRDVAERLPPVNGDPDRLQQVVWNLLSNAVKFTAPGGSVTIAVQPVGESVELAVRDSGEGIPRDFLPYVFDRFRQADASASRKHGGLGLGLALVRQIVELHGGTVGADSAGRGQGATFWVRLPAAARGSDTVRLARAASRQVTLRDVEVLLVDDNEDARDLLETALRDYGARVRTAASAEDAMKVLASGRTRVDVLVADIGMPGQNGYDLIHRLRALPDPRARVPAIAVTAYATPEDRIRALAAGYQTHMPKPVDIGVLAAAIAGLAPVRASKR